MARPNKGKTKTLRKRSIFVYLPSEDMADELKRIAKQRGISISKFVIECIQEVLTKDDSDFISRKELLERLKRLEEENSELRRENRMLRNLAEKLDEELRIYRSKPFLQDRFEGVREYSKELIDLFKKRKFVEYDELYSLLNIDPRKTPELVKSYLRQLEILQDYGIIEAGPRGWRWKL
ncbi:MAG: hypothetical protein H0Z28_08590 [Archaeoglobus sp.]|nr:hypothetical protein [Archaeoglobus sp.]